MNVKAWTHRRRIAVALSGAVLATLVALAPFSGRDGDVTKLTLRARTAFNAARDLFRSNQPAGAAAACREALTALDALAILRAGEPGDSRLRAKVLDMIGVIEAARDDSAAAEAARHEAIALWAMLVAKDPTDIDDRQAMADMLDRLGSSFREAGRWEEAETVYLRACRLSEDVPRVVSNDPRLSELRAVIREQYARLLIEMGRPFEAVGHYELSVQAQKAAVRLRSTGADQVARLISLQIERSRLLIEIRDSSGAEQQLVEAVELAERLTGEHPSVAEFQELAATSQNDLAEIIRAVAGREGEARRLLERALAIRETLVERNPNGGGAVAKLAGACVRLADALAHQGLNPASEALYRRGIAHCARLTSDHPDMIAYRLDFGCALYKFAERLRGGGRPDEALRLARRAVGPLRDAYAADLRDPACRAAYSRACRVLCMLEIDCKNYREADQAVRTYREIESEGFEEASDSARFFCECARLVREDHSLSPAERDVLVRADADNAMRALQAAVRQGFRAVAELETTQTYEPLRGREDFRRLICDIEERVEAVRESS